MSYDEEGDAEMADERDVWDFPFTDDDNFPTQSSEAQKRTEKLVCSVLANADPNLMLNFTTLTKNYLYDGLIRGLDSNFSGLDASRPWLCYWMCHSLSLLGELEFDQGLSQKIINTIVKCRSEKGGFGGGYLQMPHTAPTYASVMTLITINTREAFLAIERGKLYRFLLRLKEGGAFRVHEDGECDSRGLYTVLAVASICNILTPVLADGCAEWIASTQGFDGGIGAEPGNESHGGYAYCGLAGLVLLGKSSIDVDALTRWLFARQMEVEGGFQGRTNKLVDSCYSFWQGACFALLNRLPQQDQQMRRIYPNCDARKLVRYVVGACTHGGGGLKDKPDAHRDFYHTCYALSGLSIVLSNNLLTEGQDVGGNLSSAIEATDPVYNIVQSKLGRARAFFAKLPCTHEELLQLDN